MKKLMFILSLPLLVLLLAGDLDAKQNKATVDVLYFHATIRCQGCLTIEEFVKNSVDFYFSKELKNKTLTYTSLDFLQPENQHYQDDYKFDSQTLIIRKRVNGKVVKWKNLDKIWDYSSDYDKFSKYVEKEVKKLLND